MYESPSLKALTSNTVTIWSTGVRASGYKFGSGYNSELDSLLFPGLCGFRQVAKPVRAFASSFANWDPGFCGNKRNYHVVRAWHTVGVQGMLVSLSAYMLECLDAYIYKTPYLWTWWGGRKGLLMASFSLALPQEERGCYRADAWKMFLWPQCGAGHGKQIRCQAYKRLSWNF